MAVKRTRKTTKNVSKAVDAVDEAIYDDIQNGKIEAAMAAYEKPAPAPKAKPTPKPKPAPRTLRKGMTGTDVENMQKILGVKEDGFSFGTLVALKKWQNLNGLKADGIAGPITQAKMNK